MSKNNTIIGVIGILLIVIILVLGATLLRSDQESIGVADEEQVEEPVFFSGNELFELPNYDGEVVRASDFNQDILVVNAWATWCPFCVNELPDFAKLQQQFPEEVAVVAINRAEPQGTAKNYSDGLGLGDSITFLLDPDDVFYKSIGGFSMPETLFVNSDGDVLLHKKGPMKLDEMVSTIERFLNS